MAEPISGQVGVLVDPTDLRIVLDQQSGHAHRRPGIWDPDNLPDRANTRCVECAARDRLRAALEAWSATPASAGAPEAPPKDLQERTKDYDCAIHDTCRFDPRCPNYADNCQRFEPYETQQEDT